ADARFGRDTIEGLLARGLLLSNAPEHARWRDLDERVRKTYWWPLSAVLHAASRWRGRQASLDPLAGYRDFTELVAEVGPPPPAGPGTWCWPAASPATSGSTGTTPRPTARSSSTPVTCRRRSPCWPPKPACPRSSPPRSTRGTSPRRWAWTASPRTRSRSAGAGPRRRRR